jgi:hypothetical protein
LSQCCKNILTIVLGVKGAARQNLAAGKPCEILKPSALLACKSQKYVKGSLTESPPAASGETRCEVAGGTTTGNNSVGREAVQWRFFTKSTDQESLLSKNSTAESKRLP